MTLATYIPIRQKYSEWAVHYSPVTDQLLKRKRILLFTGATAEEWLDLANAFQADNGRANFTFCMIEYKKLRGQNDTQETPKTELPQLPDEEYDWQSYGDD